MTAAECAPFIKTGGLADVVGTLSRKLHSLGFDVRLMLPYHRAIKERLKDKAEHKKSFGIELGWRTQYAGIEEYDWDGLTVYFIDNEYYFGHAVYCGGTFEGEQYAYFSRAVIESLPLIGFEPDIIHVNDWHTAMVPMLLKTQYVQCLQGKSSTVLSIHNIGFQGRFDFGFVADMLGIDPRYNAPEYFELYGSVNFLKGGIVFADKIVTVSPSYAQEIRTPYFGEGLDGVLRARADDLIGILNGIDTDAYDPAADPHIAQPYDAGTFTLKQKNKEALMLELGLKISKKTPLLSVVSRLSRQKGIDLILRVFGDIMSEDVCFVLLGTGDHDYENFFSDAQERWNKRVRSLIKFDEALAHRIYAASDFLLMPSQFEPCGLAQMIALRYGTLPIVRETGGLKDTVFAYNADTGKGNGFTFANYNAHEMLGSVCDALRVYRQKEALSALIKNAMAQDLSFDKSAHEYAALYLQIMAAHKVDQ